MVEMEVWRHDAGVWRWRFTESLQTRRLIRGALLILASERQDSAYQGWRGTRNY